MCRSCAERPPRGRRCPGQFDPHRLALARIRQRLGRNDRAARRASDRGDWAELERCVDRLDRDTAAHEELTAPSPPEPAPADPPSRASEFTPEATVTATDEDLMAEFGALHHDPAAQEQILDTLQWRDDLERARTADIAAHEERKRQEAEAFRAAAEADPDDASPLTNPAFREHRRLSPDQQCREEYDAHVLTSFLDAESECRGHMLTAEGEAKGIDPYSLFSGPASRARKYASPELRAFWAKHGRITYAEWRFQWFGRDSDRKAAQTARAQSTGEAVQ